MPNRILKDSIRTSDDIDKLSWFEEVLFYRLIVSCDDYGRYDGRDRIIKNSLFPLKENLTVKDVREAIDKLASIGLVVLYEYEGRPYLYLPTWNDHQSVRAKKSKYPEPEADLNTSEIIGNQTQAKESKCPRNPIQSESNPNPNPNPKRARGAQGLTEAQERAFEDFWALYPKRKSKGDAQKAWSALKPDEETTAAIMEKIPQLAETEQWKKDGGQYIPYPGTWLRAQGWLDEVGPQEKRQKPQSWTELAEQMEAEMGTQR